MEKDNTVPYRGLIRRAHRESLAGHRSALLWFTGLSNSGKSTISHALDYRLHTMGCRTYVLDGDNVRRRLCADLGFSLPERAENMRRIAEMCRLFLDAGILTLASFISPLREHRERVRAIVGPDDFLEIYCKCPLEICEKRDVKGHYERARRGEIKEFTGISSPYEEPLSPDLVLETDKLTVESAVDRLLALLIERGIIRGDGCGERGRVAISLR